MNIKAFGLLCGATLFAAGCQNCPPKVIKFDSEPQGARVFLGLGPNEEHAIQTRNYIGTTPVEWTVPPDMVDDCRYFRVDGTFVYSDFVPPAAVFFADPPASQTNLFSRRQVFHNGTFFTPGDPIPVGIFFDLTKPEPEPKQPKKSR